MNTIKRLGIYLFDDVELLDFAGPLQVFSAARYLDNSLLPVIDVLGNQDTITVAKSGLIIDIKKKISEADGYDLFIIPGGFGTRRILEDPEELKQIDRMIAMSSLVASVCTGSLILAKLGYLAGKSATTHWAALDLLQELEPSVKVDRERRYIDEGKFIISEGVSAGIDMSFYLLKQYFSREISDKVRKYIEYYPEK